MAGEGDAGGGPDAGTGTAAPDAGTGTAAPDSGGTGTDWTASLSEEARGLVEARKWGSVEDVIGSYRNLESMRGVPAERLVALPEGEDAEAWGKVYDKLGRPADPQDYEVDLGDAAEEASAAWLRQTAHQIGLTKPQAKALSEAIAQRFQSRTLERNEALQARVQTDLAELKAEWGAAFDKNMGVVDRVATQLGMSEEIVAALRDSMGPAPAARFIHGLAAKLGEDAFNGGADGSGGFGAMAPAEAAQRINDLKADPSFRQRLMAGEAAAQQQWDRLHRWAYGKHG